MKMLTAADVEAAGPRLLLGKGDRLTPLARDRAKELGVELVIGDVLVAARPSGSAPAAAAPVTAREYASSNPSSFEAAGVRGVSPAKSSPSA